MGLVNCDACGESMSSITGACSNCGKPDIRKKTGGRTVVFMGTMLLLVAISFISYPYLFNNSGPESNSQKELSATDSLQLKLRPNTQDTIKEDKHRHLPSF